MKALIRCCWQTMADLGALAFELDRQVELARKHLSELESQPVEAMKSTVMERAQLQQVIRRFVSTRLELANFRGIVRARLNEFSPVELARMGNESACITGGSQENPQGREQIAEQESGNLDAGL